MPATELETLIATRRDLHRHPELAYQEHRTAGIVAERLRAAGYEVRTGIAETGVVGTLRGAGPGPTLLLRADMDALPIDEESGHDFVSTVPGRMHACGHDAHVAIGLAVAERLARGSDGWSGTVHYLFQPAEEGGGGALRMIREGDVLDGVDAVLGLHVWTAMPSGTVGVVSGPMMASSRDFRVTIRGRGGHGAIPQETVDAALVAAHAVVALHSIVSRSVSPLDTAVISVGSVQAGSAANVIADRAVLHGTMRAFRPEVEERLRQRLRSVLAGVCAAFEADFELEFGDRSYPATVNDPALADVVRGAATEVIGAERVLDGDEVRTTASEDFSEFSRRVPGCYFFLGARNEATGAVHPHHSPRFDVCEDALPVGVEVLERAALAYLRARPGTP